MIAFLCLSLVKDIFENGGSIGGCDCRASFLLFNYHLQHASALLSVKDGLGSLWQHGNMHTAQQPLML